MGLQQSPIYSNSLVQTILRMIGERDKERQFFQPQSYYRIEVKLKPGRVDAFTMPLKRIKNASPRLSEPMAKAVLMDLKELSFKLQRFEKSEKSHPAARPFSEAELILHAAVNWNWPPMQTKLYIDQLSRSTEPFLRRGYDAALIEDTRLRILTDYGKEYLPKNGKRLTGISQQHIFAPRDIAKTPKKIKRLLTAEQFKLYQLVFNRFLAWQTSDAVLQDVHLEVTAGEDQRYLFERKDSGILFRGYMQVCEQESDMDLRQDAYLWETILGKRETLRLVDMEMIKEKTKPPANYSVLNLTKIISADREAILLALAELIAEGYVVVNGQEVELSEKGISALPPQELAESKEERASTAMAIDRHEVPSERLTCPQCGKPLLTRHGRYGRFLACSGYPACRHTQPIVLDIPCPEPGCKGYLVPRRSATGKIFYGCSEYPHCRHTQARLQ